MYNANLNDLYKAHKKALNALNDALLAISTAQAHSEGKATDAYHLSRRDILKIQRRLVGAAEHFNVHSPVSKEVLYDVVLENFGSKKIQCIKAIRAVTGLGLKDSKELVEAAPIPILENVAYSYAVKAQDEFDKTDSVVHLLPVSIK